MKEPESDLLGLSMKSDQPKEIPPDLKRKGKRYTKVPFGSHLIN